MPLQNNDGEMSAEQLEVYREWSEKQKLKKKEAEEYDPRDGEQLIDKHEAGSEKDY